MPPESSDGCTELVALARSLGPKIEPHRSRAEVDRRLPAEVTNAVFDTGLHRLWLPKTLGGHQADLETLVRVVEEVSRIDSAVGWCLTVAATYGRWGGYLREDVARTIFDGPRSVVAGVINPTGRATRVSDGYRVDGQWAFGSGIHSSTWVFGNCMIMDGGRPRMGADGTPEIRSVFFPRAECEILDTWHTTGLRGTGSTDFAVRDLWVPDERTLPAFSALPTQPGVLYALPLITVFAVSIAAVPLGIARAAIDVLVKLASEKTPTGSQALLRERSSIQADVGRAVALVRSARAFLLDAVGDLWRTVERGGEATMALRAAVRLACAHAASSCVTAVDLMYAAGGASSFRESCPLERHLRDVHAAAQHIAVVANNFELAGRVCLGMSPGTARF